MSWYCSCRSDRFAFSTERGTSSRVFASPPTDPLRERQIHDIAAAAPVEVRPQRRPRLHLQWEQIGVIAGPEHCRHSHEIGGDAVLSPAPMGKDNGALIVERLFAIRTVEIFP